jgi:hypothetical protein
MQLGMFNKFGCVDLNGTAKVKCEVSSYLAFLPWRFAARGGSAFEVPPRNFRSALDEVKYKLSTKRMRMTGRCRNGDPDRNTVCDTIKKLSDRVVTSRKNSLSYYESTEKGRLDALLASSTCEERCALNIFQSVRSDLSASFDDSLRY